MVEVNGLLVRACATGVADGMQIATKSAKAAAAQVEAFDRILSNHTLHCTVCDNNNGNCTVHNTTKLLAIEHQKIPLFGQSRTRSIARIRFTLTIPINAYSAGAVLRLARMSRSTKRFSSAGKILMPACCGMAVQRSENQAATPAATASPCVPATLSWKKACWATPVF